MGNISTAEQDQILIDLIELLNEYRCVEGIEDETIERLAHALLGQLHQLEQALTSGDTQMKTYEKELHKANLKKYEEQAHAAEVLLQAGTMETEKIKKQLENIKHTARFMHDSIQATHTPTINSLPKPARTYLCVQIIVTWKGITGAEEMPKRETNSAREPKSEFYKFIGEMLSIYGDSVSEMDADNLHKDILKVEKELRRLSTEADKWVEP